MISLPLTKQFTPSLINELKALPAAIDINPTFWQDNDTAGYIDFIECHSDYLTILCKREVALLPLFFKQNVKEFLSDIQILLSDMKNIYKNIRIAKRRVALYLALTDMRKTQTTMEICHSLSLFADMAVKAALKSLWPRFYRRAKLSTGSDIEPFGFFILGLGKLGGKELNYSSDIDLIALYDPALLQTEFPDMLQDHCVRLCRQLIQMLDVRDSEGYVFRVDFRLRPDPASTSLSISVNAAERYYESHGQNWERSALIKARVIAGDDQAGTLFLKRLTPFLWRKNLDYAAIREIHGIKKRIHDHKGGHQIKALEGHNIKLGRGVIREIEFFAQAWQLIWGGRCLDLRIRPTLDVLKVLHNYGWIQDDAYNELSQSYIFLRDVEHRLQMQRDEQTQTLPHTKEALNDFALFCHYDNPADFRQMLRKHLSDVEKHYAALFEEDSDKEEKYHFNFSSLEFDNETHSQLLDLGYHEPKKIDHHIRLWLNGTYKATRSSHAQTLLREMLPNLLIHFSKEEDPQASFIRFDNFLANIGRGVQLLAIIHAHPSVFNLLIRILNGAPQLSQYLESHPHLLDALLEGELFSAPPSLDEMIGELAQRLKSFSYNKTLILQDYLELAASWSQDRRFILSVQALYSDISTNQIFAGYSHIAEAILKFTLPLIIEDFEKKHGKIKGGELCVLALGRLGSLEMTPTSDLDLIFIYEADDYMSSSDGLKSLECSQYYAKIAQRIISALTAPTAAGRLYEVDMRLRPSGNKGPLAVGFDSFKNYQYHEAWSWEHMALCRARIISSKTPLACHIESEIKKILTMPRDLIKLKKDVTDMRKRLHKEKSNHGKWDLKYQNGGIVDMEFMIQYYLLAYAHHKPNILSPHSLTALQYLYDEKIIDVKNYEEIYEHLKICQILQLYQRLSYGKIDLDQLFDLSSQHHESHVLTAILTQTNMPSSSALIDLFTNGCIKTTELYNIWSE